MLKVSLHVERTWKKDTYNLPERRQPSRNTSMGFEKGNWCELDLWSSSIEFYFEVSGNDNTKTYHLCITQFQYCPSHHSRANLQAQPAIFSKKVNSQGRAKYVGQMPFGVRKETRLMPCPRA